METDEGDISDSADNSPCVQWQAKVSLNWRRKNKDAWPWVSTGRCDKKRCEILLSLVPAHDANYGGIIYNSTARCCTFKETNYKDIFYCLLL